MQYSSLTLRQPTSSTETPPAAVVLGAYLRALRLLRGLTMNEVAAAIHCSTSRMSRLETGHLRRSADALELMEHYGLVDPQCREAVDRLLQERQRHVLYDSAPGWLDRLHACQRRADSTVIHTACSLPEIVRIPEYSVDPLAQHLRAHLSARIPPRAALSTVSGQDVTLLLDEMVLHRPVCQPSVMADQFAHLQKLTKSALGPRVLLVPLWASVAPPAGLLYRMTVHGHELIAEEWGTFVLYYTGKEAAALWQDRIQAALAAAEPAQHTAMCLGRARLEMEAVERRQSQVGQMSGESRLFLEPGGEAAL
ncbi:Scr1 family TA system antitoxin-like transcriptional regulator [Streptomyces sp. DSM 41524]|uniref:Scr1 family TA system antitoxin-like transcriptional regulator n=1 Tax=Streptomyces asiaticus subsp. ignotus TaxID=3098222 RepID=A0ABU7QCM9_9ACTN|nr:Scr1 family TA system antitoxin-like transcriptional regulator [Streptomyces sp. DSM 41524]